MSLSIHHLLRFNARLFVAIIVTPFIIGVAIGGAIVGTYEYEQPLHGVRQVQNKASVSHKIHDHPSTHAKQKESVFIPDFTIPPASDGRAPVITNVATKQNVVFLGIDDGAHKSQDVVDSLKAEHIKASLYLSRLFIADNPSFFKQITANGSLIEDHTLSHDINMVKLSYEQQKQEICGMADYEQQLYGRRPVFFRPPGGAYNDTMLRAANDCGIRAVVTWVAKANGGSMQYQFGDKLRQGDVVLMHFRPEFQQDLKAFVDAQNAAGLHTELLENALR